MTRTIAIVGAGYSGTLLALHLLANERDDLAVALFERSQSFARGLAYATHNPRHLLNVRVENMSAWPDAPGHLQAWLAADGGVETDFISRGTFGRYLASMLQDAAARTTGPQRLLLEHDEVVNAEPDGERLRLTLAMGRTVQADAVVLATGHQRPVSPPGVGLEALPHSRYAVDPWAEDALEGLEPDAPILALGAGLTMVDMALALDSRGHRGPIVALSRRGLLARRHSGPMAPPRAPAAPLNQPLSRRLHDLRERTDEVGWRVAVDELRPFTQAIWRAASPDKRRRFLRHLQPWWDAHRHRMAPAAADWLARQVALGRLTVAAGRLVGTLESEDGVSVRWRPRSEHATQTLRVARIINCTGAGADLAHAENALLRNLLARGAVRPDALGLGLDVDDESRATDRSGGHSAEIYAIGPLTRGALWEIIAVPDIRNQVAELAARLRLRFAATSPAPL